MDTHTTSASWVREYIQREGKQKMLGLLSIATIGSQAKDSLQYRTGEDKDQAGKALAHSLAYLSGALDIDAKDFMEFMAVSERAAAFGESVQAIADVITNAGD